MDDYEIYSQNLSDKIQYEGFGMNSTYFPHHNSQKISRGCRALLYYLYTISIWAEEIPRGAVCDVIVRRSEPATLYDIFQSILPR